MGKGQRSHTCPICSKTYGKAEHLIRHQRTHTGDRPYACPWCKRTFSRQDSLARHQQRQKHEGTRPEHLHFDPASFDASQLELNQSGPSIMNHVRTEEQSIIQDTTGTLVESTSSSTALIPPLDNVFANVSTDDLFLQLTWPDSEELLQSILTSNLASWTDNIELLPTQHLLTNLPPPPQDNDSPWLTQDSNQQSEGGSHAIRNVSQIISDLSANVTSEAESAALSTFFLDACLHMFFDQFTPHFQICHRPTFVFRDWTHPLLLNSIALGSLFVGHDINAAKGEVLWKLAHTAVATSWHSLILHRGPHDPRNGVQLILTALLGQTYAMLSGTARLRSTAQIFHSLGFYWARQCDMFNYKRKFDPSEATRAESRERAEDLWKTWAAEEIELRALLGHYVLDGQLPYLTGAPTCQRHASNPLPLPCSDTLFKAGTLDEWLRRLEEENTSRICFRELLVTLFEEPLTLGLSYPTLSFFSVLVIIEGLESFVSDANSVDGAVVGNPSQTSIRLALGTIYQYIANAAHLSEGEKTELILRWHMVGIDAATNFNNLCKNLCAQFNVEESVFGSVNLDHTHHVDLKRWIETSRASLALKHALAIWEALANLPLGRAHAVHLPVTVFAAAIVYCASILAGTTVTSMSNTSDWSVLMSRDDDLHDLDTASNRATAEARRSVNLLYDCNVFLMRLRQLKRPWGICAAFESIIQQLLSKCGV